MTLQAVLFDFDGTLVEQTIDFAAMREGVRSLALEVGVPVEQFEGRYVLELIGEVGDWLGGRDAARAEWFVREALDLVRDIEMAAAAGARIVQGCEPALAWFRDRWVRSGIVTRNCRESLEFIVRLHPVLALPAWTRDDVSLVKPHPSHLRMAASGLGVAEQDCLVVGDHPMDMKAANAVGMLGVGVLTGGSSGENLLEGGAWRVLPSVGELPRLLIDEGLAEQHDPGEGRSR